MPATLNKLGGQQNDGLPTITWPRRSDRLLRSWVVSWPFQFDEMVDNSAYDAMIRQLRGVRQYALAGEDDPGPVRES